MVFIGINVYCKGNLKQDIVNVDLYKFILMLMQGVLDCIVYVKGVMEC